MPSPALLRYTAIATVPALARQGGSNGTRARALSIAATASLLRTLAGGTAEDLARL
jgi:hypothetical protein